MLWQRFLTAICLIPLVLWGVFSLNPFNFSLVSLGIFVFAAWEWAGLCKVNSLNKVLTLIGFILFSALVKWYNGLMPLVLGSLLWIGPVYWVTTYPKVSWVLNLNYCKALYGLLILSFAWHALCVIQQFQGPLWVILLFILVWSCDTVAYFVGKKWGKTPLLVAVSPKKTLAGFWGGLVGTLVLASLIYGVLLYQDSIQFNLVPFIVWVSIAYVTILLAVLGDLFESLIKRLSGVKDSGQILPGHGGLLDRIDSLVATLPFYALSLVWTTMRGS